MNWLPEQADSHVSLGQLKRGNIRLKWECCQHVIFISEADVLARLIKNVDVTAAAKGSGSEGRHDIPCIERNRDIWLLEVDEYALSVRGGVLPVVRWILWSENKRDAITRGAECRH